jgi:hypothetical protein
VSTLLRIFIAADSDRQSENAGFHAVSMPVPVDGARTHLRPQADYQKRPVWEYAAAQGCAAGRSRYSTKTFRE